MGKIGQKQKEKACFKKYELVSNSCLTLIWWGEGEGGSVVLPLPSWSSLNNSQMVKAVTVEFCSIQQQSIRYIHSKFGIHNSSQSPAIGKNSDKSISNFRISGQSLIKENCHNSRTSDNVEMKLRPVTKLDRRNKTTSKKMMMTSCQKIVMSLLVFRYLANLEQSRGLLPDTQSTKVLFSVLVTFCLTKTESRTKKSLTQLSHYCFQ